MRPPAPPATVNLAAPAAGSAWRTTDAATEPSPWRPRVVGADALRLDRFEAQGVVVDVAQAYFAFERQGAELIYHDHRFVADDAWVRVRRGRTTVDVGGRAVDARFEVFRTRSESRLVLWWYWQDGRPSSDLVALKLTKAQQRLRGMFEPAAIVLVSTPFYDDFDDALERLRTFLATAVDLRPTVVATD
jgi:EpsI family protein